MIDFACKRFNLNDIVKCGLGLTRAEFDVMEFFLKNREELTTNRISKELKFNLTTTQKAVKKLNEKGIILRHQKNLSKGGYVYTYECASKTEIRRIIKKIIQDWSDKVNLAIDGW